MAEAKTEVVYSGTSGCNELQGRLFGGIKFWLAQAVPQRSRFIDDVKARVRRTIVHRRSLTIFRPMGEVVLLDKQADVLIVDHARKHAAPGTQVDLGCLSRAILWL